MWLRVGIAIVGTLIILKIVDLTIGLRVTTEHEIQGLDSPNMAKKGIIGKFP